MTKKELLNIKGGINITGSLISSITKGISVFVNLGRTLGSSIRRIVSRSVCRI